MDRRHNSLTLTKENFQQEVLKSSEPVLVDFWADWCGPCRAIAPVIEELAEAFEGRAKVGKVDVEDQPALAWSCRIRSIPTLLFFRDGKLVDRLVGAIRKEELERKLTALLPAA